MATLGNVATSMRRANIAPRREARVSAGTLTRADIAEELHRQIGLSRADSARFVERILEIEMSKPERDMFEKSLASVQGLVEACKGIDASLAG